MNRDCRLASAVAAGIVVLMRMRFRRSLQLLFRPINGRFGALVDLSMFDDPTDLLRNPDVTHQLYKAWQEHGGLLVIRGVTSMTAQGFAALSAQFGEVETELDISKRAYAVDGVNSVMRLGNVRDTNGKLISVNAISAELPENGNPIYDIETRTPVWHTDGTYRANPPIGSLLYCGKAPPVGAATCFADTAAAYSALPREEQQNLSSLECVCSLAHHDEKVRRLGSKDYPSSPHTTRIANPPVRAPVVLKHPLTNRLALYGMNSSTCAVLPLGSTVDQGTMHAPAPHACTTRIHTPYAYTTRIHHTLIHHTHTPYICSHVLT
jgi:alpha-ketoglutarate-dependent taurine dioxygenase